MSNEVRVTVEGDNPSAVRAVVALIGETLGAGEDISVLTADGETMTSSEYMVKTAEEIEDDFDMDTVEFTLVERFSFSD